MKKTNLLAIAIAAAAFFTSNIYAEEQKEGMEQCKVVDAHGKGLILENKADSGLNKADDANAWIWVPKGECAKINHGDLSGVSDEIKAKIDTSLAE